VALIAAIALIGIFGALVGDPHDDSSIVMLGVGVLAAVVLSVATLI
jgi:hypothetical protein